MDASLLFKIANTSVLPAWLLLVLLPHWKYTFPIIRYGIVVALASLYVFILFSSSSEFNSDSFSTLENVQKMFQQDTAVLAGWIHYLAFDLLVGTLIVEQAKKHHIHRVLYTLALPFTFFLGPVGYLIYVVIRLINNRNLKA
jgi:hypothetical protein